MTKSLMIEIDEATKDIMTELQDGLTKNIESRISSSIQSVMQRQERSIKEIEYILQGQLLTVSTNIESTKKPITRMVRDVEHSMKLLMDVEKLQKEQAQQLSNIGQQQIDSIKLLMTDMLQELARTQEAELAKSIQSFDMKSGEVTSAFISNLKELQQNFVQVAENTQSNLVQQYDAFISLNEQLEKNEQQLHQEINIFQTLIDEQKTQFEQMTVSSTQQLNDFCASLQQSFDEHITAITKQYEKQTEQLTNDVKQQVKELEEVAVQFISLNEKSFQRLNSDVVESVKLMEQQILYEIVNNKGFDALQEKLSNLEMSLTTTIKEQALADKLADIEKDLAYARLPFYKKWFTKREDF
ncbi:hypothetical protein [Metasolibacillus meyeri]|uniref:hypothetical protein n=1 Tax=Metasolibacillus meyeri TaxID=1071052 RepID=UPI000D2FC4F8|nr:hypothetical protein [Metasolibacillus meyeri]